MTMNMTDIEVIDLSAHDFELECECNFHLKAGAGEVVAIVYYEIPCCGRKYDKHICQGCLTYVTNNTKRGWDDPPGCGGNWSPWNACIKDVVPL